MRRRDGAGITCAPARWGLGCARRSGGAERCRTESLRQARSPL